MSHRTYSDDQLVTAVAEAHSWRGVLRALGLSATSAGSGRSVRRHADRLGLSYDHFTGQRRWSDRELMRAVQDSLCWADVVDRLGMSDHGNTLRAVRSHAIRIGASTTHFTRDLQQVESVTPLTYAQPRRDCLRTAGPSLAAAWFMLRGAVVMWPIEPCRYDLLVESGGAFVRVQVKTTTYRDDRTSFATISTSARDGRTFYTEDEIDYFFVIDSDLDAYFIPVSAVSGRQTISLSAYRRYRVAAQGRFLTPVKISDELTA